MGITGKIPQHQSILHQSREFKRSLWVRFLTRSFQKNVVMVLIQTSLCFISFISFISLILFNLIIFIFDAFWIQTFLSFFSFSFSMLFFSFFHSFFFCWKLIIDYKHGNSIFHWFSLLGKYQRITCFLLFLSFICFLFFSFFLLRRLRKNLNVIRKERGCFVLAWACAILA